MTAGWVRVVEYSICWRALREADTEQRRIHGTWQ